MWLPMFAAGYVLYRYAGEHRDRRGAGSHGFAMPPVKLVTDGPYAYTRNPMYLGHLLSSLALVLATRSPLAGVLAVRQAVRFSERVAIDEDRLERIFGDEYRTYVRRVPRWIRVPGVSSVQRTPVTTNGPWQGDGAEGA